MTSLPILSIFCICIIEILDDIEINRLEVLTLCFDFQSRAHVSARSKKNSRDTFFGLSTKSKHTSSAVETYKECGQNKRQEWSKDASSASETYFEHTRSIPRAQSNHIQKTNLDPCKWWRKCLSKLGWTTPKPRLRLCGSTSQRPLLFLRGSSISRKLHRNRRRCGFSETMTPPAAQQLPAMRPALRSIENLHNCSAARQLFD